MVSVILDFAYFIFELQLFHILFLWNRTLISDGNLILLQLKEGIIHTSIIIHKYFELLVSGVTPYWLC